MSEPTVDIAALRDLYAAVDPSLLPLQVCAGIIPRSYFVQAANGEQFAAVHDARLAEAALVVESINQLPPLMDAYDERESEGVGRFKLTEGYRATAALDSIEVYLEKQRQARGRLDRLIGQLEELAAERRAQIEAGTWPPKQEEEKKKGGRA